MNNFRNIRKAAVIFMAVAILALQTVTVFAADTIHIGANVGSEAVNVGDEITLTLNVSEMTVSSFGGGVKYDPDLVEYVSYSGDDGKKVTICCEDGDEKLSVGANSDEPYVGFFFIGVEDKTFEGKEGFITITFRAKAEGSAEFMVYESSSGKDGVNLEDVPAAEVKITKVDAMAGGNSKNDASAASGSTGEKASASDKQVVELIIDKLPTKTSYAAGQEFDPAGMVVIAKYSDGTSQVVQDYIIYDQTMSKDVENITIKYGDVAAKVPVSVDKDEPKEAETTPSRIETNKAETTPSKPVPNEAEQNSSRLVSNAEKPVPVFVWILIGASVLIVGITCFIVRHRRIFKGFR